MSDRRKTGVVTVTYNSEAVIDGFLRSLLQQSHGDFVLYVIDNASSDTTLNRLAGYHDDRIVVIRNAENRGVAAGNNQGIRASLQDGCDAVLLINNDTEFEPQLLEKLSAALEQHGCDMATPKMLFFDSPARIWCAGGQFNRAKGYLPVHYGADETDRGQHDVTRVVEYTPTCCVLVRSSVFHRIGAMDERYFLYFDDTDFLFRAQRAGMKLVYLPKAKLWHKVSSLTGGSSPFAVRYLTRNHVYFIRKNLGFGASLLYLPAYEVRLLFKMFLRIVSWDGFTARQSAFFEGLRMPLGSDAEKDPLLSSAAARGGGREL